MLKHIVMFKLKESYSAEEKAQIIMKSKELTRDFLKEIPSLVSFEHCVNSPLTPESNYEIALVCEFEDVTGLDEYQVHPIHKVYGEFICEVRELRACIDY